ncbi:glycosyltransferase [Streptomyces flavidovirens]
MSARPAPGEASTTASETAATRTALLLTGSAALAGAGNYGLSLFLVRQMPDAAYVSYTAASSVLLAIGALAGATMPAMVTCAAAGRDPGGIERAVRTSLPTALAWSLPCAAAACLACAAFATPALLAALTAAATAMWINATGAGRLQARQDFHRLALLWPAEVAVRAVVTALAVLTGWYSTGAIAAFAVGAATTATASLTGRRTNTTTAATSRPASVPPTLPHWRQATTVGGIQALVCLLPALDVITAAAVRHGDAALASYQAVLVLARIPLFVAAALATVLLPRLAAAPPGERGQHLRAALRLHWICAFTLTAVLITCPTPVLALALPHRYTASASLLLPLGITATACGALTLAATVFLAQPPRRALALLLACACLTGLPLYTVTAAHPTTLAWTAACLSTATAGGALLIATRRVPGLRPAAGAALPLGAAGTATGVLSALREQPLPWCLAALAVVAATLHAFRTRPRRPGPPRILHLAFEDPRMPGAGGGSIRTHEINRRLAARGLDITAVCAPWPGCTPAVLDQVRYQPLPRPLGPLARHPTACRLAYFAAITACLPALVRRADPDLVVEDFAAPFSSVAIPYLTRRPVIAVVQWLSATDKTREYHLPFDRIERYGLHSHTTLIAVSDGLTAELRRRHPRAHVTALPNGLDPAARSTQPHRPRQHLLYLGRLETTSKGLDLLLHAYAKACPRICADLWIAGDGPHAHTVHTLATRLGINHRIRWLGHIHGAARFQLLASARLLCMPSRYETFGMAAAEALATATPVLAFDIPNLRDLVTDTVGVRVPAGDVHAYSHALTALAGDPDRCRRLGAAGPAAVAHLNWETTAERQLALYRQQMTLHARQAAATADSTKPPAAT